MSSSGLREALTEQMAEKFGSVEGRHAKLIEEASEDRLKGWLRGILTAPTAAELLRT